ncbi:MAG TPA: winged helix DNA-binding domain-containing protein [Baekduia sp.]|uniref:winged helix DNA-binding domain-containing protein n=1 Tax=Baekduia sp. TaxID=2600305 RepID=UPI002C4C0193|nr:winged helix DNA-binding domain-containing protein [Baekduia sp.]HMJ37611.1 winged helix DNA-binding domain-containing protein [Baekduia sp.]
MSEVLSARALNRALLARQGLLERTDRAPVEVVEHLVGLQAQDVKAPYYGLWTRIADFDAEALSALLAERRAVRVALMRGTIHLVSARDALALRPVVQEMITRATHASWGPGLRGADLQEIEAAGRALVEARPRTFAQLAELLGPRWPEADPRSLAQFVRALVALVQVPPRGLWGRSGQAAHTSAEHWLDGLAVPEPSVAQTVLRYLGAFGPASALDVQKWSGLTKLGPVLERLRPQLVSFSDESGRELFDLPGAPRPDPDTPVAVRLVAPFDNVLLSHVDTTRILPAEHRGRVMTQNGLVSGTYLVDGFVQGGWKVTAARRSATLTITPFGRKATKKVAAALEREGARLLAFAAPGATERTVELSAGG